MPPRLVAALSRLPNLGEPGPLFRRQDGQPYVRHKERGGEIRRLFASAVVTAGLDPKIYTPHVCRHSWATWFYATTKDVVRLCAEGGWRSNEWKRYTKLASPELAAEVAAHNWAPAGHREFAEGASS